jgi:Kyakuja-Dileera-Zisupton transposase
MKYPIAVVNRLLDQYGKDIGLGYDIMCAFIKTLLRSSLGAKIVGLHLQGVIPAFHGHAHNRGCQVHWHPMYMEGVGLEDFEECE